MIEESPSVSSRRRKDVAVYISPDVAAPAQEGYLRLSVVSRARDRPVNESVSDLRE
jgi:hypothetical protein